MDNLAKNYQNVPTDTNGLDDLFGVESGTVRDTVQPLLGNVQDPVSPSVGHVQDNMPEEISVLEASKILNVDRRSVVRLLNWQKLSGRKDERGRWIVNRQSVLQRKVDLNTLQDTVQDVVSDSVLIEIENTVLQSDSVSDTVLQSDGPVSDVSSVQLGGVQDSVLELVKQQGDQLKQAYTYLDAATARILYLQDQLDQKDQQIKLLTDSQHKPSWWRKLASWFKGAP